jgi:hypothetical protein
MHRKTSQRRLGNHPPICSRTSEAQLKSESSLHAHNDHAGGIAVLQRDSGAEVAASKRGAEALRQGCPTPDDPQVGDCSKIGYGAIAKVKEVKDGESLKVGDFFDHCSSDAGTHPRGDLVDLEELRGERLLRRGVRRQPQCRIQ